ncbi:zinc finger with KRAB and SCAN domains 1 [Phyllostomus discolor]|uniref:Zinc finger with KRAB and SCAN domains 1 n=1 Tax=Phyllostomus discolor TaxID=89673 RepID=A0A834B8Q8_9CHIR|nr:zinc finger with KRAB and SCAN domains 1 [Phyllostomus discolor]
MGTCFPRVVKAGMRTSSQPPRLKSQKTQHHVGRQEEEPRKILEKNVNSRAEQQKGSRGIWRKKLEKKRKIQGQLWSRKKKRTQEREVPGRRVKDWEEASV